MQKFIIVGAGDFGREVYFWTQQTHPDAKILGFIDDNVQALADGKMQSEIISTIKNHVIQDDASYVMGIADPRVKLKLATDLTERGAKFTQLIHPTAIVSTGVRLGVGVVLCPYVVVSCHVTLGDFTGVNWHCTIGHDVEVGEGCTLSPHVALSGHVKVGKGAFFGTHATVLPKICVGDFACVGAGGVAVKHVKEATTVVGVPARPL